MTPHPPANVADWVRTRLQGSHAAIESLAAQADDIAEIAGAIVASLHRGATIYTCGNGGSAAQALHLAEELIGRYRTDRPPQRAICLNADPTALTCIANDYGYEAVFARQCEALIRPGDVLIVLSTSGNSANLLSALRAARDAGGLTIGLLGRGGGKCLDFCHHGIVVAASDSAHIQEAHTVLLHLLCEAVEREPVFPGIPRTAR